jgi:hypothetical protein
VSGDGRERAGLLSRGQPFAGPQEFRFEFELLELTQAADAADDNVGAQAQPTEGDEEEERQEKWVHVTPLG